MKDFNIERNVTALIVNCYDACNGCRKKMVKELGISERTLYEKLRQLGLTTSHKKASQ